ncbi:V-type ATP synthase subunit D [Clostridium fallax]|uniref:V-type ATP synthase subunit D n=1 Tax=Clostridium fallax TaxID=1533 RepID=A0A1M4VVA6_9CLOT|nr:V-type ATP synthase subunit D [Clostridium fallax]SHE72692.1 V/A-type H+-transporting ATPase subunit D [Clostridium fallax]SQB07704.1 V-type sodium ATP synthase subunit D [Clostridium fallax]
MENFAPTKATLMAAKNSLEFSKKGFELLDKKRNVLIKELMTYVSRAYELQGQIDITFKKAYKALQIANITSGIINTEDIGMAIKNDEEYDVIFKSVMGVEVPKVIYKKEKLKPVYGFYRSNGAIDEAVIQFNKVKYLTYELAEVENAIFRLAMEVKKTQRRANALQNIQIPKFIGIVKFVTDVLEEKDREDLFRMKKVKKKGKM